MACFLVPMATAIITTSIRKKVPAKYHINWLNSMLWGGVVMLAVEHISSREVVFYPPFLTLGPSEILLDMLKIGVPMTLSVFLIWTIMVIVAVRKNKICRDIKVCPEEMP